MPDESVVLETPATEAATPELDSGLLSDEQIAEIFGKPEDPKPAETPAEEAKPAAAEGETPAPAAEVTDAVDLTALNELDKEEPKPAETPATADSEFLAKVKAVIPNEESLGWAIDAFQRTTQAAQAARSGDVNAALESLPFMKPVLQKAVIDYIKANEDRIIEAYIAKHDPNAKKDPEVAELKKRVQRFEQNEANKAQLEANARQQRDNEARVKAVDTEIQSLFDKVKFTKNVADRKFVTAAVKLALAENGEIFQKVLKGQTGAIRPLFSKTVKEYVEAEKAKVAARPQETKPAAKPIIGGGGNAASVGDEKLDVFQRAANYVASTMRKG